MQHSFDIEIAQKFTVPIAIFLNNIAFWIVKNQANERHLYEGRYWTYNSSEALSKLFPYWSSDQIDRIIKKCKELGLLLTNNFNDTTYDRTRWFGLTDLALNLFKIAIPRNRGMDSAKSETPFREIAEPIPDIKPDIKPDEREEKISTSENQPNKKHSLSFNDLKTEYNLTICKEKKLNIDEEINKFMNYFECQEISLGKFNNWLLRAKPQYITNKSKTASNDIDIDQYIKKLMNDTGWSEEEVRKYYREKGFPA